MSNSLQMIDQGVLPWEAIPDLYSEQTGELISPIAGQILTTLSSQTISPLEKAHLKATLYWLQTYQPTNSSLDEIVKGYLDAFYHLAQVENWTIAYQIFSLRLPLLPDYIFYENLGIWGYYREQINMGEIIFSKINDEVNCLCLLEIGNAYCDLGEHQKALEYYQQLLDFATQINNLIAICQAYGGCAKVYNEGYKADLAIEYFQKQLELSQTLRIVSEEIIALVGLDFCYAKFDNGRKKLPILSPILTKINQVECKKTLAFIFGEIGAAFALSNNYTKAIDYLQQSLQYSCDIYSKKIVFRNLGFFGICQAMSVNTEEGIKTLKKALYFFQKRGDLFSEVGILNNLAVIHYYKLKNHEESVFYLKKALKVNEYLDHPVAKSYILAQLAFHYNCLNNHDLFSQCANQALAIAKQENSKSGASHFCNEHKYLVEK
jgi:tetratricopeptide (TPR) repeat protein